MTNRIANVQPSSKQLYDYSAFTTIDGKHPWQTEVPAGHVLYRVRKRKNGKIAWFNFELAKEMGLLPADHAHELNQNLEKTLLDTFAIQIINEYDLMNGTKIDPNDIKPNFYMATRYLQLQHPGRTGVTSGDGRSIWNGVFSAKGKTWDVSSCGTGATCLSPATHKYKKFFRTGDPAISYGCGYSDLDDGIMGAMFSEILHKNGHETERCLLVIEFPGNLSINVRAGTNLLRPSHFFNHLKQGNLPRLKAAVDYFIKREVSNGAWPAIRTKENPYQVLLSHLTKTFAEMAARFESEYIFCWLAWDGDNILCNGGIIDYGSIRQFGLFHHEYRFDDVDRFSTNIVEQKQQAKYLVQTFAQIVDFINTGKKRPVQSFKKHAELKRFEKIFSETKKALLLKKIGFTEQESLALLTAKPKLVNEFQKRFTWFERQTKQTKKPYRVADGLTRDALYCMRDILRTLPAFFLKNKTTMSPKIFMETISSNYCREKDRRPSAVKIAKLEQFQKLWLGLMAQNARTNNLSVEQVVKKVADRSAIFNRYERVTGDAICHVGEKLLKNRKHITRAETFSIINKFIEEQVLIPESVEKKRREKKEGQNLTGRSEKIVNSMFRTVKSLREGI